ncbi:MULTISPECIES: DnaJ domain-containing protein [unclassified Acidovorax]|uniref:DnaJ domain-containing protein n=1 Tax=unclassified Acidovorax TaxID=2684926 RepID=UPI00023FD0BF|nr:DnaJ domain-containing protein [Acidovorax sp. NO-1]EHL22814.1 heat shock protein DnaJ domain-containing protein [Acidovorax sp. NO-1]
MTADHYAALGLAANASLTDIKKAFRQKASFYHPDRNTASDAAQRFAEVQKAYEVLSDDDARQAYDDNRRRNLLDDPLQTAQEIWQAYSTRILSNPSAL